MGLATDLQRTWAGEESPCYDFLEYNKLFLFFEINRILSFVMKTIGRAESGKIRPFNSNTIQIIFIFFIWINYYFWK